MIRSILCENVKIPAIGSDVVYEYILETGKSMDDTKWGKAIATITDNSEEGIKDLVDVLRKKANDNHHVYIEGFEPTGNGMYRVWIGS